MELEWQKVFLEFQDSPEYSNWSEQLSEIIVSIPSLIFHSFSSFPSSRGPIQVHQLQSIAPTPLCSKVIFQLFEKIVINIRFLVCFPQQI